MSWNAAEYYRRNREHILTRQAEYVKKNKKKCREYHHQWYLANKERLLVRMREYQSTHKEQRKGYARKYASVHPKKVKETTNKYRATHKEKVYAGKRKLKLRQYDLTPEQYTELLLRQNGVCAICGRPETRIAQGTVCSLAVDHDHITGKTRGLLCTRCNMSIGRFEDNPLFLQRAADYLNRFSGSQSN